MPALIWLRVALCCVMLVSGCLRQDVIPDVTPSPVVVDPVNPVTPDANDPLRVLVLYDADPQAMRALPQSQLLTLQGLELREWLEAHQADYRIWDKGVDTSHAPEFWQQAVKLPHDSLPWIWASRGGRGFNGQLQSTAEIIDRLNSLAN